MVGHPMCESIVEIFGHRIVSSSALHSGILQHLVRAEGLILLFFQNVPAYDAAIITFP